MRVDGERKETGIAKILVLASALLSLLFAGLGQAAGRTPAALGRSALPVLIALESRGPIQPLLERKGDGSPAQADRSRVRGRALAIETADSSQRGPSEHAVPRFATLPESIGLAVLAALEAPRTLHGQRIGREAPHALARQQREALPSPRDPPSSPASPLG